MNNSPIIALDFLGIREAERFFTTFQEREIICKSRHGIILSGRPSDR